MELTPEQQNAIARLYENESLTENLTDQDAQALLEWAQRQIVANTEDSLVRAAVSAANSSGEQGVQTLVTQASAFLAQELAVRAEAAARATESSTSMTMGTGAAPPATPPPDDGTDHSAIESRAMRTMGEGAAPPAAPSPDDETDHPATENSTRPQDASAPPPDINSAIPGPGSPPVELTGRPSTVDDAVLAASGSAAPQDSLSASAGASVGPDASAPSRPPKRKKAPKSRRSKKK